MDGIQEVPMSEDAPSASPIISTVKEKRCPKCGEIKPLETFGTDKRTTDNCRVWCKTCERTYNHIWRKANPEYGRIREIRYETYAEWTDVECPKCGHAFVARDKFGLYCCISGCNWRKYEHQKCPYCGKPLKEEII